MSCNDYYCLYITIPYMAIPRNFYNLYILLITNFSIASFLECIYLSFFRLNL